MEQLPPTPDNPEAPAPKPEVEVHSTQPQPLDLDNLLEAIGPLVKDYFDHAQEMERLKFEYEGKALEADNRRDRWLLVGAATVVLGVLGLSGYLIYANRDASAIDLIKLVATIVSVGFGGYGFAMRRQSKKGSD